MNKFFISTPIGFESTTLSELKEIWPRLLGKDSQPHTAAFPSVTVHQGGLELEADFFTGLQLNFFLKTANRVLLRMAEFKARDLPKFYQKFKALPWKDYLYHPEVRWEIAAQTSRVNNEKRLHESAYAALCELFVGELKSPEVSGTIYIRLENDLCTVSLDTTGDHLHKRGWGTLKGEAPLRETIAALAIKELIGDTSEAELPQITLLDPMMGSGTFLIEARMAQAGQFQRSFAFQKWKRAPKLFQSASFVFNYRLPVRPTFRKFRGVDIDADVIRAADKNWQEAERQLALVQKDNFQKSVVDFVQANALAEKSILCEEGERTWMVVNPPYGERLDSELGLQALGSKLTRLHRPERLGILYPEKERFRQVPHGYKVAKEIKINNGGLRCLLTVLTRL